MNMRHASVVCTLLLVLLAVVDDGTAGHVLFDYEVGLEGWYVNVYGEGELSFERVAGQQDRTHALGVRSDELHGGNLISPPIPFGDSWRLKEYDRIRFRCRTPKPFTKGRIVFVTNEKTHPTYSLSFVMEETGWREHLYPLSRSWNRGGQTLDATRIVRIYVNPGQPTAAFDIDHIELLEAARVVHPRHDRVVRATPSDKPTPVVDGRLTDPAWEEALVLKDFVRYGSDRAADDQTEASVWPGREALYIGARLHASAMDRLKAEETARDAAVWQDDCLEVFIDREHSHQDWYQFVTNSKGARFDAWMPGGTPGRGTAWNADWEVVTRLDTDFWVVEMMIPYAAIGGPPSVGEVWGFNVCREAPSTGELSMWTDTGGRFTRIQGLADLVFGPFAHPEATVEDPVIEESGPGDCVLRVGTRSPTGVPVRWRAIVQAPGADEASFEGEETLVAGEGEWTIPLAFDAPEDGEARLIWRVTDREGMPIAYSAGTFGIVLPHDANLDEIVLIPSPREMMIDEGYLVLDDATVIRPDASERSLFSAGVIQHELMTQYGIGAGVRRHLAEGATSSGEILIGVPDECPELAAALEEVAATGDVARLQPEGYVIVVTDTAVLVAGADARGVYYGARTVLQLVSAATPDGAAPRAPLCRIVDWPEHSIRGAMIYTSGWPQDPHDPEMLKEFIYRQVAGYKFNTLVWQVKAGYRYRTWPRLANRCAMSRDDVKAVAGFAKDHFLDIVPAINVHGHANWMVLKYPHLQEDGRPHQICTRHPDTYPMLFDIIDELQEVFDAPEHFHVGLDEVRWKTFNLPEEERCPRCLGVPKWQIYAEHINRLHDYITGRGMTMWMWGDMLVPTHNGGPPFDCRKAIDRIPRDIVMCNWSAEYAEGSSEMLARKGFRVIKSNSNQVPPDEVPHVEGNLASFWYRHPWCPLSQAGERGLMLRQAYAAEYSWHTNRDNVSLKAFERRTDLNVLRHVARPPRPRAGSACEPLDISAIAGRALRDDSPGDGDGWADLGPDLDARRAPTGKLNTHSVRFHVSENRTIWLDAEDTRVSVDVRRKCGSILLLHTVIPPEGVEERKIYLKRFLAPNEGVVSASMRVTYASGETLDVPLRAGMEVGFWRPRKKSEYLVRCPYIVRFATEACRRESPGDSDAVLYVFEWTNPNWRHRIDRLDFVHSGTEAAHAILGVSTRELKE